MDKHKYFISSLFLNNHPMKNIKPKIKEDYYHALVYFTEQIELNDDVKYRLDQYRSFLLDDNKKDTKEEIETLIASIVVCRFKPWRRKYRYWLMCDIALIFLDEAAIQNTATVMKSYMTQRQQSQFDTLLLALKNYKTDTSSITFADNLISQYHKNQIHFIKQERRFIVTANMSAGKSTLINALIGKPIARTSQEVCTGNICYLYSKAFEDGHIHLESSQINFAASQVDLTSFKWESRINIASYFRGIEPIDHRLCIIDTPGINSAINRNHGRITREALTEKVHDKVIYVLNANKLGTDEEMAHLKWISENAPKDKIIFVLNKLDDFNSVDDDISTSIDGVRNDLISLGYENPVICPMSAYFALLIKMKHNGDYMTDDEQDEYTLYTKKFSKLAYDLSQYYEGVHCSDNDNEGLSMSKRCGLYGLEKILFGGVL